MGRAGTFGKIRKEKNPRKLVGLGSVFILAAGVGLFPPERCRYKGISPARAVHGEIESHPCLLYILSLNYGPQILSQCSTIEYKLYGGLNFWRTWAYEGRI